LDRYDFSNALANVWYGVHKVNTYLVVRQPWALERSAPLLSRTLYRAADLLGTIAVLVYPFLPEGAERIWKQLGCEGQVKDQRFSELRWGGLQTGTRVGKPEPIFPRLDKEPTLRKLAELAEADRARSDVKPKEAKTTVEAPAEQKISIEDFAKVEMRVGEVKSAEPVQGAQKLMKLAVDIGSEVRQVVAGIAEYYKPEQLIGMKVVIVTNLQPRKLRGVESNGMVVAATVGEEGRPVLVTFKEDVPNGARLK
jgi:methionyl-tRNA synthetase